MTEKDFEAVAERARVLVRYMLARLQEPSTWRGIVLVATACGIGIDGEQAEAITALGLAAAGLVGAAFPDRRA